MNFVNSAGSRTGKLLPTGCAIDEIELSDGRKLRCSLVDAANPAVFFQAADVELTGTELPADTATNPRTLAIMEEIRVKAAKMMRLASSSSDVSPAVPKVAFVASPSNYTTTVGDVISASEFDLLARTKAFAAMHKAYAVTGGICVSAAAMIEGTVVHEVVSASAKKTGMVRIGHPSGVSRFMVGVTRNIAGEFELTRSAVVGTARRIMDGYVYVPSTVYGRDGVCG
jgi:2-methylaconitate cis-trans-isomerase PrpF